MKKKTPFGYIVWESIPHEGPVNTEFATWEEACAYVEETVCGANKHAGPGLYKNGSKVKSQKLKCLTTWKFLS